MLFTIIPPPRTLFHAAVCMQQLSGATTHCSCMQLDQMQLLGISSMSHAVQTSWDIDGGLIW